MATIKRFEEIRAWQEARELSCLVYRITRQTTFSKDFGLKDQLQRAAVSVASNIAEGFARNGNKEFAKFLGRSLHCLDLPFHPVIAHLVNYR